MRRNTLLTARGRYSLSNVHNGYADRAALFRFPSRLCHQSPRRHPQPTAVIGSSLRADSINRDTESSDSSPVDGGGFRCVFSFPDTLQFLIALKFN